jgi:hypothetical protein
MKQGFVLIEVLLALVIALMMGGILINVLYQGTRAFKTVNSLIDNRERWVIGSQIIMRDLAGACIPLQVQLQTKQPQAQKKSEQPEQQEEPSVLEKQSSPKPLTKLFASDTKDGMLSTLTFITNNPLPVYDRGDTGIIKPKIVRVTYTVKLDKESEKTKPTYTLYREETVTLEESSGAEATGKSSAKSYVILTNIKSIMVTYTADMSSKDEKNKKEVVAAGDRWKTFTEWNVEKEGGNKELLDRNIMLPTLIEVVCTFWKSGTKEEQHYSCMIALEIDTHLVKKQETPAPQPPPVPQSPPAPDQSQKGEPKPIEAQGKNSIFSSHRRSGIKTTPLVAHNKPPVAGGDA